MRNAKRRIRIHSLFGESLTCDGSICTQLRNDESPGKAQLIFSEIGSQFGRSLQSLWKGELSLHIKLYFPPGFLLIEVGENLGQDASEHVVVSGEEWSIVGQDGFLFCCRKIKEYLILS